MKKLDIIIGELFFIAVMLFLSKAVSMVLTQANLTPVVPEAPPIGLLDTSPKNGGFRLDLHTQGIYTEKTLAVLSIRTVS